MHFHFNGEKWYMYIVHVNVENDLLLWRTRSEQILKGGIILNSSYVGVHIYYCKIKEQRIRKIKLLILWACPHVLLTFILTSLYINSFIIILYYAIPIDSDT